MIAPDVEDLDGAMVNCEVDSRHEEMRAQCNDFHERHPGVWDLFVRFALEKIGRGYRKYGAKAIMERVRWETDQGGDEPALKINDHYTAFYARRFARAYPTHAECFRTRIQKRAQCKPTNRAALDRHAAEGK